MVYKRSIKTLSTGRTSLSRKGIVFSAELMTMQETNLSRVINCLGNTSKRLKRSRRFQSFTSVRSLSHTGTEKHSHKRCSKKQKTQSICNKTKSSKLNRTWTWLRQWNGSLMSTMTKNGPEKCLFHINKRSSKKDKLMLRVSSNQNELTLKSIYRQAQLQIWKNLSSLSLRKLKLTLQVGKLKSPLSRGKSYWLKKNCLKSLIWRSKS